MPATASAETTKALASGAERAAQAGLAVQTSAAVAAVTAAPASRRVRVRVRREVMVVVPFVGRAGR
ncbi:hypothetical protein GCM10009639_12920 [Kitasatospora putterlickiae]|uniref:Uncharacterized protein n=1 Tax=Kitasatospora putterlickiae TaxID=221725 RepID=A0ABP4IJ06_9ACTN